MHLLGNVERINKIFIKILVSFMIHINVTLIYGISRESLAFTVHDILRRQS